MQVSNVQSETQRRTWVRGVSRWVVPLGILALMPELMGLGGCPCGDDADCVSGDFCQEGACVDCRDNADCSEELPVCVDTFCEECGVAADCDDGNACTTDTCDENNECARDALTCDDGDPCTTDSCDEATGCVFEEIGCDAGEVCDSTTGDCQVDLCFGIACGAGESCNPATGACGIGDGTPAQVDVLQFGELFYPTSLFRCAAADVPTSDPSEGCPDGSGCDESHWHSDTVTAISSTTGVANASGNTIDDPNPCFCGHGKVSEVTRTTIDIEQSELGGYLLATSLDDLPAAGGCPP